MFEPARTVKVAGARETRFASLFVTHRHPVRVPGRSGLRLGFRKVTLRAQKDSILRPSASEAAEVSLAAAVHDDTGDIKASEPLTSPRGVWIGMAKLTAPN